MRYLKLTLFFILFTTFVSAQIKARVYGYIYNSNREPIEYVCVQVNPNTCATFSRSDGYYELEFQLQDTATIMYSLLGMDTVKFIMTEKQPRAQKIVYMRDYALEIGGVEIKEFAKQSGSSQDIDFSKIKIVPDASGGIEPILKLYGASSTNEMSSQYSVRGGSYDENSVYVNDIEVYRPLLIRSGQQEGLSFINPDMVGSLSFSAGGFEAKYGDKMSSVLDIRYKKPKDFESSVSMSFLGGSAYLGQTSKNGKFSQLHGIRYKSSDYLLGSLETSGDYNQSFFDYQTYLSYIFKPKWELSFLGNLSYNYFNLIPESRTTSTGTLNQVIKLNVNFQGQEKDVFRTMFGAATLSYKPNSKTNFSLLLSAFNTKEDVNYTIEGSYALSSDANPDALGFGSFVDFARNSLNCNVINLSHKGSFKNSEKNLLEWSLGVQREMVLDNIYEWQTQDSAGYSLPYLEEGLQVYYNQDADLSLSSNRFHAYVQDKQIWALAKSTLIFQGGVRASYWSFNEEMLISPRFSLTFIPKWKKELVFRFASGAYYQSPFYKEIKLTEVDSDNNTTVKLNSDIQSQRSLHFVFATDYYFRSYNRPFKLTTEIYYKPADRVIPYEVDNVKITYAGRNMAKAYTSGIDFKLFGEFVPGTDSWISLSFMQSKEDIEGDYKLDASGQPTNVKNGYVSRPNEQLYNLSLFFQDYFPGFPKYKFHMKFIWADGLPFWAPSAVHAENTTRKASPYRRVDVGVSRTFVKGDARYLDASVFKVAKSFNLAFEVFNLLDIDNEESQFWVKDVYGNQYAIPNYLTQRLVNLRLSVNF